MVEANEDAMAVTMKIRRETRVAREYAEAERAASAQAELQVPPPIPSADGRPGVHAKATVAVPSRPADDRPVDPDTAYRRARLGFMAVVVLVLLLVWVVQRRSQPPPLRSV